MDKGQARSGKALWKGIWSGRGALFLGSNKTTRQSHVRMRYFAWYLGRGSGARVLHGSLDAP